MKSITISLFFVFILFLSGCISQNSSEWGKNIMVIVAHQDDEIIGAGTIMSRAIKNGGNVTIIITTDGAPKEFGQGEFESQIRKNETLKAASLIGISKENVIFLDYDDLGFIFEVNIDVETERIKKIIQEKKPDTIFVQAYEGGHIDHDATNFLVVQAVKKSGLNVNMYEFPEYNAFNWGKPIPDDENIIDDKKYPLIILNLTENEQKLKKEALMQYVSQKPAEKLSQFKAISDVNSLSIAHNRVMTEHDFFLQKFSLENGDGLMKEIKQETCKDDYLVCRYYWPDMIRKLPNYDYEERPHKLPPQLLYEEFLRNSNMTKTFYDFKNIVLGLKSHTS